MPTPELRCDYVDKVSPGPDDFTAEEYNLNAQRTDAAYDMAQEALALSGGGGGDVVADTTPQLGGDLDLNGHTVGAATAADLTELHAAGTLSGSNTGDQDLSALAPKASPAFTGTPTGITKAHVGLGSVDNTADASKPVSTAQAAADAAVLSSAASFATAAAVPKTVPQMQALRDIPVAAGLTIASQATGSTLAGATSSVTGTLMVPQWTASTYYPTDAQTLNPSDGLTVIKRTAGGTSRSTYDSTEQALWTSLAQGAHVTFPMRYSGGFLRKRTASASDTFAPRSPKFTDGTEETLWQPNPWSIDFDWYTTGGALEVPIYDTTAIRFIIDGQYAAAAQTQPVTTSDFKFRYIKLSGVSAGTHRVRIEVGSNWASIGGIKIATGDVISPPSLPRSKRFAMIGDSYCSGYTGSGPITVNLDSYAPQLARILGFSDVINEGVAGSGFILAATQVYGPRIDDMVLLAPDYLFIQGTANDFTNIATLPTVAQTVYADALTRLPNTKIVASGAFSFLSVSNSNAITAVLKTAWAAAGGDPTNFIDTTNWPTTTAGFIGPDSNHPTLAGHKYLALRLTHELASRWNLPIGESRTGLSNIPIAAVAATGTPSSTTFLRGDGAWSTPTGSGDASTNTATSVDSEVVLFSSTTGKLLKRATGSGIAKLTSGVLGTATPGTDYVAAGTPAGIGPAWWPAGYVSGNYYLCNSTSAAMTSNTLTNGNLRLSPWVVTAAVTVVRLFIDLTVIGDVASTFRLGIYNDSGAGVPSTLVLDAGTIATGSTTGVFEVTISQALTPGLYWVGGAVQGVSSVQPTLRVVQGTTIVPIVPPLGTSLPAAGITVIGYNQGGVTGALPSTFSGSVGGSAARIGFKVS